MNYYTGFLLNLYIQAPEYFADISHIVLTTSLVSRDIFTPSADGEAEVQSSCT